MIEIIHDSALRCSNTITLDDLLEGTDLRFREAVIEALIREGFELDEPFPYLQHPLEILGAIHWLGTPGIGTSWGSFRQILSAAGSLGILVDLRLRETYSCPSMSQVPAGMLATPYQTRLETA